MIVEQTSAQLLINNQKINNAFGVLAGKLVQTEY